MYHREHWGGRESLSFWGLEDKLEKRIFEIVTEDTRFWLSSRSM